MKRRDRVLAYGYSFAFIFASFFIDNWPVADKAVVKKDGGSGIVAFYDPGENIEMCRFTVKLALTEEERLMGLKHIQRLPSDMGMLFVFEGDGLRRFWMKETLIPLDIIFINSNCNVVYIHRYAMPLDETLVAPATPAKYVLEVKGGTVDRCNIKIGSLMRFITNKGW